MKRFIIKISNSGSYVLPLLIALVIIRGTIYISIVPPWLAPDEPAHFEAIRLIGQEGLRPTKKAYLTTPMHSEMATSFEKFRIWNIGGLAPPPADEPANAFFIYYYPPTSTGNLIFAGNYPLLYHYLLAPVSALIKTWGITGQLYLLRFISLLFTVFVVITGWFFTKAIFPTRGMYAVALSSFLVFLPMHIHVNSSVNTDVLTTLLTSLYFLMLVKIFEHGASAAKVILAGSLQLAAILTKPTALFTIPTSAVAVVIYLGYRFRWRPIVLALMLITTVILVLPAAVLLFQLANGGREISTISLSLDPIDWKTDYFSRKSFEIILHTTRFGFLSFWGLFGWNNIPLPGFWVRLLWMICLLFAGGAALFFAKNIIRSGENISLNPYQKEIMLVLLLSLIFVLVSAYTPNIASQTTRWGPASRYLFPALLPLALYLFLGFQQLVPVRVYGLTLPIWLTGLILYDSLVLAYILIPVIYG